MKPLRPMPVRFANCSAFKNCHSCINFSHERKSERIERKFETQNSNPELVMIGGNLSPQYLPGKEIEITN